MTTRIRTAVGLTALLAGVSALAGCATTEPDAEASEAEPRAAASGDCADDDTATATGPVELTDSYGRTVSLDEPAERVAVLEWQQTEDVLTLCVTPVAVADVEGFTTWVSAEQIPDGVTDVGTRGEPNFDALLAADPDLVIIEAYSKDEPLIEQLEKYDLNVLATKGADAADPLSNMKDTFSLIAEATGREDRADAVLEDFDASLAESKEAVEEAEVSVTDFVYFDGWIDGGNVMLRPFGQGSLVGELGEELGLTNAWTEEVDPMYGLGQSDVEGMTEVGDATMIHTGTVDEGGDVAAELAKNPVWSGLPAVEEGRVHPFPAGIWTFGGPRSAQQVLDAYVELLTS